MTSPQAALSAPVVPPEARIERLPTRLINQIAAGEVVTRPAAAVKELIENSLDAGAARVEISVEDDALSFSVRDDGRGMGEADLALSIERYATSKIRELDDLTRLGTRGFRGEALAAISAVSRMEVVTRTADTDTGLRLRVSGGKEPKLGPRAANVGTSVTVRDLFFNTPVRLKFLKRSVAEWGHILQAVVRQALTRSDVAFAVRWRGRPYLDLPAGQSLRDRLAQILPGEAAGELLEIEAELHGVRVTGAAGGPGATRRDRRHQYFFCNRRPILFRPLTFAMEEAYKGLIMTQRYPMAAILIDVPGEMVDVNVHPTKEQVRFQNEALISGAVHRAVLEGLRAANLVPRLQLAMPGAALQGPLKPPAQGAAARRQTPEPAADQGAHQTQADAPPLYQQAGVDQRVMRMDSPTVAASAPPVPGSQLDFVPGFGLGGGEKNAGVDTQPAAAADSTQTAEPAAQDEAALIQRLRQASQPPRAVAQLAETYILAEAGADGMLVIDQHAAHEKILYLEYNHQVEAARGGVEVQPLLVPHSLELSADEGHILQSLIPALGEAGFDVAPFGGQTFVVQAVPVLFDRIDPAAFVRDLIDEIGQGDLPREMRRLRERIQARAACRAAVKSGDRLGLDEMQHLLEDLLHTEDALRCPHGRPTVLLLTRDQLDRQFGRI